VTSRTATASTDHAEHPETGPAHVDLRGVAPTEDGGADRVRRHTDPRVIEQIDAATRARVAAAPTWSRRALDDRIADLEREWDVERVLEVNAATLVLVGSIVAIRRHRAWAALPAAVGGFLLQHAVQGWCPPLAIIRRLPVRTRREIEAERWALKAVRGDLDGPTGSSR
jgi:hypothetical protein